MEKFEVLVLFRHLRYFISSDPEFPIVLDYGQKSKTICWKKVFIVIFIEITKNTVLKVKKISKIQDYLLKISFFDKNVKITD